MNAGEWLSSLPYRFLGGLPETAEQALAMLIDNLLKGCLLLAGASLATLLLHRAPASLRHQVWTIALAALLVLPLASLALPQWSLPILELGFLTASPASDGESTGIAASPPASRGVAAEASASASHGPRLGPSELAATDPAAVGETSRSRAFDGSRIALWVYLSGALLQLLLTGLRWAAVAHMVRRSEALTETGWRRLAEEAAASLGLRRPVALRISPRAPVPLIWGLRRPAVVLPEEARRWPLERRRIVLLHELAHVRRKDHWTLMLGKLACVVHWIDPLTWLAVYRHELEREHSCDDAVLQTGTRASSYARQLLALARRLGSNPLPSPHLAMAKSSIEPRIRAILNPQLQRGEIAMMTNLTLVFSVLLLSSVLATVRLSATPSAGDSPAEVAAQQLLTSGDRHLEILARALRDHDWQRLRADLPRGWSDSSAVAPLILALEDDSPEARRIAAWALGEIRSPEAVAPLRRLLSDDSPEVRRHAAQSLGDIGSSDPVWDLVAALADPDPRVRERSAHALGDIRSEQALDALGTLLDDDTEAVRQKASWAIREIVETFKLPKLMEAMDSAVPPVRLHAAHFLGDSQSSRAVPALTRALLDESPEVRSKAAWALGEIRSDGAVAELIRRATDEDEEIAIRAMAIRGLGEIGSPAAVTELLGLLGHRESRLRSQAADALGDIGHRDAVSALERMLEDNHPSVRENANKALRKIG